jgi:hypothetical protein
MLEERARYVLSFSLLFLNASSIHSRIVVEPGINLSILGKMVVKNSKNSGLQTKAKGIWQMTKKEIRACLNGSTITWIARLPNPSACRITFCVASGVLSAAASVFFLKDKVFLGVLLPCSEISWALRRCCFLLSEFEEEVQTWLQCLHFQYLRLRSGLLFLSMPSSLVSPY